MTMSHLEETRGGTSGSNALADSLCTGRHLAQKGFPDDPPGEDAVFGITIHSALANDNEALRVLSVEQREIFDRCREIEQRKVQEFFGAVESGRPGDRINVIRETRYWVTVEEPATKQRFEHSSRVDVVWRKGPRALIGEYKTLRGEVPESNLNKQLRDQMALFWGNAATLEEVGVFVDQPLVERDPAICVYRQADFEAARNELFARVLASNNPQSVRVAGDVQCAHCKAKRICVEYQRWVGAAAPPALSEILTVPMPNWTPGQRAAVWKGVLAFSDFGEQVKAFLKAGLAADPSFVPGFALTPGAKQEVINDPQKCFERFAAGGGEIGQFMRTVAIGKTKLREVCAEVFKLKGKPLDSRMDLLTEGIVDVKQAEPSIRKADGE